MSARRRSHRSPCPSWRQANQADERFRGPRDPRPDESNDDEPDRQVAPVAHDPLGDGVAPVVRFQRRVGAATGLGAWLLSRKDAMRESYQTPAFACRWRLLLLARR